VKRFPLLSILAAGALAAVSIACSDAGSPVSATSVESASIPGPTSSVLSDPSTSVVLGLGTPSKQTVAGEVLLRVAHLSTDAPPVDIWVNGSVALSNVPFKTVSDYLGLDAGTYRIQVTPAGAPSPVVIDANLDLMSGHVYTVAAVGFLSSGTLQPLLLLDDRSVGTGARIRFVHASADTGAVDVAVAGGGPVLFENISFAKASGYVEVPGGTYDLAVRPAGSREVALEIPGVTVENGTTYTVFAVGRSFNRTLAPLPVVDAP
jgi:Domain of unknown function (DUF4397)